MHEKQVLGAILQGDEHLPELMDLLHEDMFSLSSYKAIFRAAKHLYNAGRAVSMVSIMNHDNKIDVVLMMDLSGCISSTAGLLDCAKIVAQEFIRREIISVSITSSNRAKQQDDVFDILQYMGANASKLEQTINPSTIEHIAPIIALQSEKRAKVSGLAGIPTGFKELDEVLGGWVAECLIIIAARPAMGKTSLMLSFAYYVAKAGYPVDLYSMEMSKGQLSDNLLSMHSGVALWKIQRNKMDYTEQDKVKEAEMYIASLPIHIDDQPRLKGRQLRSRITMGVKKRNTALVMVDYIQIMGEEGKGNREQEIANISGNLKAAAKEAKIPVIALAQLSREVEKRSDRRPQLSDLRESGAVEQDADVVMFPFRAWYYHTQGVAGFEHNEKGESNENLGELLIAKHRHGMVADIPMAWDGSRKLFYDKVDSFEPISYGKMNRPFEDDFDKF